MPEPVAVFKALSVAALISAVLAASRRWSAPIALRPNAGRAWCLAVGVGFYLGLSLLGVRPRWPIREDQDRFLGLVVPVALAAELVLRALQSPTRAGFAVRLVAASALAPVVLYGSGYVADLAGPGSAEWSPGTRWSVFLGSGLTAACVWSGLVEIQARSGSAVRIPLAQAVSLLASGVVVMFSGYASGGLTALPLAAAMLGACVGAGIAGAGPRETSTGIGFVGLSCMLMMGMFFGRLRTVDALVLYLSPLLTGIPESPPFSGMGPRFRTMLSVFLTACAALAVAATAWRRFSAVGVGL